MVLIDQFLERVKEAEIDAIYDGEDPYYGHNGTH